MERHERSLATPYSHCIQVTLPLQAILSLANHGKVICLVASSDLWKGFSTKLKINYHNEK